MYMDNDFETKRGRLERWLRKPDESGFGIFLMQGQPLKFTGEFDLNDPPEVGDELEVVCLYSENQKWGDQYRVQHVLMRLPGVRSMERWLVQKLPWIGPVRAQGLSRAFGNGLWDVLERDPESLCAVDGITMERALLIVEAYGAIKEERILFQRLLKLGFDPNKLGKLFKGWREAFPEDSITKAMEEDPYQFCAVKGITFQDADALREKLGIEKTDPRRICAFVAAFLFDQFYANSTCAVKINAVMLSARTALRVPDEAVYDALDGAGTLPFPYHFTYHKAARGRPYMQLHRVAEWESWVVDMMLGPLEEIDA